MPRKTNKKKVKTITIKATVPEGSLPQPQKVPPIKASLKAMGKTCTAEGQTAQEAILNLKPEVLKGTGILTLERGEVKKEKIINSRIINNLYGKYVGRVHREIALKHALMYFDGVFK